MVAASWTDSEDALLRSLRKSHADIANNQLAKLFGDKTDGEERSQNAVESRISKLGLRPTAGGKKKKSTQQPRESNRKSRKRKDDVVEKDDSTPEVSSDVASDDDELPSVESDEVKVVIKKEKDNGSSRSKRSLPSSSTASAPSGAPLAKRAKIAPAPKPTREDVIAHQKELIAMQRELIDQELAALKEQGESVEKDVNEEAETKGEEKANGGGGGDEVAKVGGGEGKAE